MRTAEFLVIGGGIAGASVGYALAEHGEVILVEAEDHCGYHTTGRSAALLTEAWETHLIRQITKAGRDFFEDPPWRFTDVPLVSARPIMLIGRPDQAAAVDSSVRAARSEIPTVRLIDEIEARQLCPAIRPGYMSRAVFEPNGRAIDVDALLQGFLRGIRRRRGEVLMGERVERIRREGSRWIVSTKSGVIAAEKVINAAGSWGDEVAKMAGVEPIGLQPMRRTAFTFAPPAGVDIRAWPAVIDIDEQFYFEPEGVQLLGSLAEQTPMHPHDVRHEEVDVALAIERIQAATTLEIRSVRRAWAGLRTFAPDRNPVVGPDPDAPNFVWLVGQGGFGIMTSPGLSAIATSLIIDGELWGAFCDIDEAALRPDRFRRSVG